jgi:hypothetical protein
MADTVMQEFDKFQFIEQSPLNYCPAVNKEKAQER